MSWSEVFPVLTDEMVDAFESDASIKERKVLESYFSVASVHNARPEARHIVSTCIFWKNIKESMPDIEIKTRAQVMRPGKKGLLRFDPWSHYVEPLIRGAYWLQKHRKEAVFRVYLAADMRFLVPDLVAAGCEVFVMKSNSLAHNPGAMWRFLAFEDAGNGRMVTVVDADRAGKPETDMAQTEEATRLGLGWWRVPVWGELNEVGNVSYRPILGCQFGGNQMLPTKLLMQALIWNTQKGKIDPMAKLPGCKPARVHGSLWPDYGFDEWFLQTAVYPRSAFDGLLTFVPAEAKSRLLPLDIEYAQWANPKSEMVYFGSAGGGCCGGEKPAQENGRKEKLPLKPVRTRATEPISAWMLRHRDFPNPKWRAYNPSICRYRGKLLMAYRFQPAYPDPNEHGIKSVIMMCQLKEDLSGTWDHRPVEGLKEGQNEDPRIFIHNGELHLAYTLARYPDNGFWRCQMELARIKADKNRWKAVSHYDLALGTNGTAKEKNWQFFSQDGNLHCAYRICPHLVFNLTNGVRRGFEYWSPWKQGDPHGGTPPVRVDAEWFSFFHAWTEDSSHQRCYRIGAYSFNTEGLVTGMTARPLLESSEADGFIFPPDKVKWRPKVLFPGGAVYEDRTKEWLVSLGINDSYSGLMRISHQALRSRLVRVQGVTMERMGGHP